MHIWWEDSDFYKDKNARKKKKGMGEKDITDKKCLYDNCKKIYVFSIVTWGGGVLWEWPPNTTIEI